jgi:hypothetical protein
MCFWVLDFNARKVNMLLAFLPRLKMSNNKNPSNNIQLFSFILLFEMVDDIIYEKIVIVLIWSIYTNVQLKLQFYYRNEHTLFVEQRSDYHIDRNKIICGSIISHTVQEKGDDSWDVKERQTSLLEKKKTNKRGKFCGNLWALFTLRIIKNISPTEEWFLWHK